MLNTLNQRAYLHPFSSCKDLIPPQISGNATDGYRSTTGYPVVTDRVEWMKNRVMKTIKDKPLFVPLVRAKNYNDFNPANFTISLNAATAEASFASITNGFCSIQFPITSSAKLLRTVIIKGISQFMMSSLRLEAQP